MSKTFFDEYNQFADACGIFKGSLLSANSISAEKQDAISLALRLVREEWGQETEVALTRYTANPSLENLAEVADGITDTMYVLCQLARALGIPLNQTWNEVQQSNMAKVGADGKVTKRADGKVLKPEGWKPPQIFTRLLELQTMEQYRAKVGGAENWSARDFSKSQEI